MASTYFFIHCLLLGALKPVAADATTDNNTIFYSIATTNSTFIETSETAPTLEVATSSSEKITENTSSTKTPILSSSAALLASTPPKSTSATVTTVTPPTTPTGGKTTLVTNGSTLKPTSTLPVTIGAAKIAISETNLLLSSENFIELSGNRSASLHGFTLAVYDAVAEQPLWNVSFSAEDTLDNKGLYVINVSISNLGKAAAVVLFETASYKYNFSASEGGIQSHMVFSANASSVGPAFSEVFFLQKFLFVLNKMKLNITSNASLSLSHCGAFPDYPTLTFATHGDVNNCSIVQSPPYTVKLTNAVKPTKETLLCMNITANFKTVLAEKINNKCQCGLHPDLVQDMKEQCSNNGDIISFRFNAAVWEQLRKFQESYQDFIEKNEAILFEGSHFTLKACSDGVCGSPAHKPVSDNGNISVTVAVVLSCIAVFCIILIGVIIYMRNKRRTILQFRMTRLHEDDDMIGDMDDFVGNSDNSEPSFTNSRYNLSS